MTTLVGPVLVIGCGLIGTSLGLKLREQGIEVQLDDGNEDHLLEAVALGAGTYDVSTEPALVIVAVPPSMVVDVVNEQLASHRRAVITDVASIKASIVEAIDDPRFVGSHPMAGRERSGPSAAVASLFEGRPWAIVPSVNSSVEAVATVTTLAETVGAMPTRFAPDDHDQAVALVSHVPQLVSSLTAGLLNDAPEGATELAGAGLRDVTRIARSDTGLWLDIVRGNRDTISSVLRRLRDDLDELIDDLDGPVTRVAEVLDRGRRGTTTIPGKHGSSPADVATVHVAIDDVAGELARLIVAVGATAINIEDLRIDHELGRPVGLVEIDVIPDRADRLTDALNAGGWTAYT